MRGNNCHRTFKRSIIQGISIVKRKRKIRYYERQMYTGGKYVNENCGRKNQKERAGS